MNTINEQLSYAPVGKLLLKYSVPAIAGMLVNSLYNLLDRIFVGRLGALAMTGIGGPGCRFNLMQCGHHFYRKRNESAR